MSQDNIDASTFSHKGWTFTYSSGGRIAAAGALEALGTSLSLGSVPLPEMTFVDNFLQVQHVATGLCIRFDAAGALKNWHSMQTSSTAVVAGSPLSVDVTNYDVTFTTAYEGDVSGMKVGGAQAQVEESEGEAAVRGPIELLRAHQPLLCYARVPLYASDLNDRGVVECAVKLRVMDDAFIVLFRAFTRLDHNRVRLHDVRLLHSFAGTPLKLLKDVQLRVAAVADVLAATAAAPGGLPAGPPSFFASPPAATAAVIITSPNAASPTTTSTSPSPLQTVSLIASPLGQQQQQHGTSPITISSSSTTSSASNSPVTASLTLSTSPISSSSSSLLLLTSATTTTSPRSVHPVVLASMRERLAKQGLYVADDGEIVGLTTSASPPAAQNLPDHAASFFSPPPVPRPHSVVNSPHTNSGGDDCSRSVSSLSLWPARPGSLLAQSSPTLIMRPADDSPLRLDVSAEEVWDRIEPLTHDVFRFDLI
jgi:hypothetical protein